MVWREMMGIAAREVMIAARAEEGDKPWPAKDVSTASGDCVYRN
jgi:hypothetical protein